MSSAMAITIVSAAATAAIATAAVATAAVATAIASVTTVTIISTVISHEISLPSTIYNMFWSRKEGGIHLGFTQFELKSEKINDDE